MARQTAYRPTPTNPTAHASPQAADSKAAQEADDFLDEIDDLLETSALETVRAYVQLGGQ